MDHQLALNFEDGVTRFVDCRNGESVVDAAYRAGINIPLDCRDGACGTCKCRVESGAYHGGNYCEDALSDAEAAQGYALACQMRPETNCVIDIAATSLACKAEARRFTAVLRTLQRLSASTFALSLDVSSPAVFLPGQYANILIPGSSQWRSYSFSVGPGGTTLSFLIRNVPQGSMSTFLSERAQPGMTLDLNGPMGSFYLRDIRRPLLFVAGGTGLAPFLSMLDQLTRQGTNDQPVHLVYGVSNDTDLVENQRLVSFLAEIPRFSFEACVSATDSIHPRKGHVMDVLDLERLNGGDVDIYTCGPPPMVEALRIWLDEQGVAPANFYAEKFAASGGTTARLRQLT